MQKIVVATKNKGKIAEIRELLRGLPLEVVSLGEEGIDAEIVEDGKTFEENALIKARTVRKFTTSIVIADDSGLEVDCLRGAPGIYSARFAGEPSDDARNNAKLLDMLKDVKEEKTARFVCAIAAVLQNGKEIVIRGECEGVIVSEPKGTNGFGYDPLFYIPEYGKTMAELDMNKKNVISHRAVALRKFKDTITEYLKENEVN